MSAAAMGKRTFAPVRRNSRHEGEREHLVWRRIGRTNEEARQFIGALIKAAEQLYDETKAPGKQMGALGLTGIKVLRALCGLVCYRTGRLEPSIARLEAKTKLARATVVRALARLKAHGFLDWLRRTEPIENDGAGPQVRQITNAYWFALKDKALAKVRRLLGRRPPIPACEAAHRREDARATERMLGQASCAEQATFIAGHDNPLGKGLAGLGRALDESASSESRQNPAEDQR
jgi:DNA-binding MarR family transcriptional regulator